MVGLEEFGELLEGGAGEVVVGVGAGDHPEVELGLHLELGFDVLEEAPVAAAMAAALETRARLRGGKNGASSVAFGARRQRDRCPWTRPVRLWAAFPPQIEDAGKNETPGARLPRSPSGYIARGKSPTHASVQYNSHARGDTDASLSSRAARP